MSSPTRIAWPLRAWFAAELFFAITATLSVGLRPADTASSFAWTIKPEVMAALIGSFYMALAPVVILALVAKTWESVRVFVLPGAVFTFVQLVVTFLHWDRFAVGTAPFWIWFASYLLPPPIFLACYVWQERRSRAASPENGPGFATTAAGVGQALGKVTRVGLLGLGALFSVEALIGLFRPAYFAASAPWKITPLNARALSGYLLLLGLFLLSAARENHRGRVRLVAPFLILLLPVVAFQVNRFSEQVDWRHPRIHVTAVLLALVAGLGLDLIRKARLR
jgi:hypothetical protein